MFGIERDWLGKLGDLRADAAFMTTILTREQEQVVHMLDYVEDKHKEIVEDAVDAAEDLNRKSRSRPHPHCSVGRKGRTRRQ